MASSFERLGQAVGLTVMLTAWQLAEQVKPLQQTRESQSFLAPIEDVFQGSLDGAQQAIKRHGPTVSEAGQSLTKKGHRLAIKTRRKIVRAAQTVAPSLQASYKAVNQLLRDSCQPTTNQQADHTRPNRSTGCVSREKNRALDSFAVLATPAGTTAALKRNKRKKQGTGKTAPVF